MPANYGILYEEVFGVSPEVSLIVAPNLTVRVRDKITRSPIEGAKVTVNTSEAETDASGLAIFGELPAGEYSITISKSGYKGTSKTVTFEVGELIEITLWPLWGIALGLVSTAAIGVVIIERLSRPKK